MPSNAPRTHLATHPPISQQTAQLTAVPYASNDDATTQQDKYVIKTLLLEPHITPAAAANDIDPELLRLLIAVRAAATEPESAAPTPTPAAAASEAGEKYLDGGDGKAAAVPVRRAGLVRCGYADALALHDPGWKDQEDLRAKVRAACAQLVAAAGSGNAWLGSPEDLAEAAPRLNVNSHGVGAHMHADGSSNSDLAVGLFPMLSMLNHSCRRAVCVIFLSPLERWCLSFVSPGMFPSLAFRLGPGSSTEHTHSAGRRARVAPSSRLLPLFSVRFAYTFTGPTARGRPAATAA